jgi:long-chain fatty acid transport protein
MADVTWTDWSAFDELRLEFDDGSADAVQPEEWDDAYRFSLGASYRYNDAWTLRAGVAYDQSPVPGADRRTPRIPDDSRTWVTVGASYRLSEAFSFDVAYAHIFIGEVPIRDTEVTTGALANGAPVGSTLDGEFDASVDILSAQIQWKF